MLKKPHQINLMWFFDFLQVFKLILFRGFGIGGGSGINNLSAVANLLFKL
jgi:hypothetical protein